MQRSFQSDADGILITEFNSAYAADGYARIMSIDAMEQQCF